MAQISMTNDEVRVELTRGEKLAALHGDVRVPRSAVRDIRVDDDPLAAVRGLRAPGLNLPRRKKIGTWRGRGHRQFVVARQGMPAVRVLLEGTKFDELIISTPDADAVAAHAGRR